MLQSRKKKTAGAPSWMKKNTTKSDLSAITTWIFFGCRKESIVSSHTNLWAETDGAISTSTFTSFVPRNVGGQNHVDPKKTEFATLQGINISHQTGKGKSSSKCHFWGDMLVPWRVFPGQLDISINISKKKCFAIKPAGWLLAEKFSENPKQVTKGRLRLIIGSSIMPGQANEDRIAIHLIHKP